MMRKSNLQSRLASIDWDFPGDKCSSAFSTTHWHPCRFVSQIPTALIGHLSNEGDVVLDPFCGSGTTIVEAQRLGRKAIGADINPVSIMIAESKSVPLGADRIGAALERYWSDLIKQTATGLSRKEIHDFVPPAVQSQKWYHPQTLEGLALIWRFIAHRRGPVARILRGAFSSILLQACNETRHWGYVCDNTRPIASRAVDSLGIYRRALDHYKQAYELRDIYLSLRTKAPKIQRVSLVQADARRFLIEQQPGSVDLVVTSPPYFGVCDYVKAQRLSMEWFGWAIEDNRKQEIGARSKRHRLTASDDYLKELDDVLEMIYRVLRKGGYAAFVFGESNSRTSVLADFKGRIANRYQIIFETRRVVPPQRRQHPSLAEEWVFVGQKG